MTVRINSLREYRVITITKLQTCDVALSLTGSQDPGKVHDHQE